VSAGGVPHGENRPAARADRPVAHPPLTTLLGRAVRRRCPRCGVGGIWRSWFAMTHACPRCGLVFERGESSDFFIGAYLINLVVAELSAVLVAAVMWITLGSRVSFNALWGASMLLAVVMPIVFYPFSRGLWLAFDLHFRPSERGDALE
jgi:uncharacterized protein (DUF983 family)